MANGATSGKLRMWLTADAVERQALDICAALTAGNERLLVIDAAGCMNPSRLSRATTAVAKNTDVVRLATTDDFKTAAGAGIHAARQRGPLTRTLLLGLPEHLCVSQVLTRETARALGRIKQTLEGMRAAGMDVTILCRAATGPGTRPYVVSSLCAFADEVRMAESDTKQNIDSASAAIA